MADIQSLFPALSRITTTSLPGISWEDDPTTTKRMELFVNSALCVIHNLSKSTKYREKFRTPEMRKTLDQYKGSPSSQRRSFSLLAISYMADPAIDMALLEDKYGVISELTGYLDKSLSPGNSTGFSVQELVEGLANLAVHPINKDQIIDKSLHLFYTILERNINEKLTLYVKEVLDGWGFSDVGCPTGAEQCQGETPSQNKSEQHGDDTNESADNLQMLDNLQCVLSECEHFDTNDAMDILGAVKHIVSDKADCINIRKHMTKHEWPDLLVRIISDVWIPGKEGDLSTDELSWSILADTIDILVTYSDADVEFADVLIEHGTLELMQTIANSYYQHFWQKIIALHEKVGEYRGVDISSGQPGSDEQQSMDTTQTKDNLTKIETTEHSTSNSTHRGVADTDGKLIPSSEKFQEREFNGSGTLYTLKPVREYACVNDDSTIAYRKNSDVIMNRAVLVSNEPIESSKPFELNIDRIVVRPDLSMELGVCIYNEFPDDIFYEGSGFGQGSGFWFLRDNKLWKDFVKIGGGYKLNLRNIQVNDRVGFVKHPDGTMAFLYNGQYQGIAFRNIPEGVYALVAISGKCVQVSIAGDSGTIIQQEASAGASKDPFESFSVRTVCTESVSFSRLRNPYELDLHEERDDTTRQEYIESEKKLTPIHEINQRNSKGYVNEIDMRSMLKFVVNLYNIHHDPKTRVDPISKVPMRYITSSVKMYAEVLTFFQWNNSPPKATNILPNRLKQIFDVVRPCFDNIQDMSGIVWTGSTSEGFAIADNSGPGTPYVDDEMDLMIPLAMAIEDSQISTFEDIALPKQTIFVNSNELEAKANEREGFGKESLVTELENIGKRQKSKEYPSFIWRPSNNPGYVSIVIPESMQSYISEGFIKHVCARSPNSYSNLLLTRSKLLAIQEEYIRGRLPAVQSHITSARKNIEGQFQGQLRLVQEGPVQTISIRYQSQESGGSVLEFDQTVDIAIALKGVDWPTIANSWISRKRHWPEKTIVDKIIKDGYHIVPKYYPGGSGIDLEWRLSFSVAERTLAHTFTDNQRTCYMVFKKIWRKYLKMTLRFYRIISCYYDAALLQEDLNGPGAVVCFMGHDTQCSKCKTLTVPKVLSSYHIKTTMFWLCERTSSSDWMESNVGERYLDLQNFLIRFLQRNNVPNFFIPENNMISNVDPADVNVILAKAQDVRLRLHHYLQNLVSPSTAFKFK